MATQQLSQPTQTAIPPGLPALSHPLVTQAHDALVAALQHYMPLPEIQLVSDACLFGDIAHIKDKRKSGEPYITHPIAVAEILAECHMDVDTIIAALLHDTIEDTAVSKADIIERYGDTVANLVDGVTKLKISKNKAENKAATFSKILTATLDDSRVIIIKLADRLHNMSTMQAVRPEKRISTAQETLDFYLPFARIMGLNELANKIELYCLQNLDPVQFDYFQHQLNQRQLARQHRATQIKAYFYKKLDQLKLTGQVYITDNQAVLFRRFFKNKTEIQPLLSSYHFTIVLDKVSSCDVLVDYLRHRYRIEKDAIEDHIRKPYPGGYQALNMHYEYDNESMQVTIQTDAMRKVARFGAMLGEDAPEASRSVLKASLKNLHELVDQRCAITTTEALLNYLHHDKVLVYTCHGDLQELPLGATVLDFAYAINDFLGHHAISATVDGKPVKLATKLVTGQKVTIGVDPLSSPNADWLSFLVTTKARKSLQHWLSEQSQEEQIIGGKDALQRALKHFGTSTSRLTQAQWDIMFAWQQVDNKDAIYQRIAQGSLLPQLIVSKLFSNTPVTNPINANVNANSQATQSAIPPTPEKQNPASMQPSTTELVLGTAGIQLHYGNCCNPILGDAISGHLSQDGLTVHRFRCDTITHTLSTQPQQIIGLQWNPHYDREPRFTVILRIQKACDDALIDRIISHLHTLNVGVNDIYSEDSITFAYIVIRDRDHVARVVRELRALLGFPSIKRLYQL